MADSSLLGAAARPWFLSSGEAVGAARIMFRRCCVTHDKIETRALGLRMVTRACERRTWSVSAGVFLIRAYPCYLCCRFTRTEGAQTPWLLMLNCLASIFLGRATWWVAAAGGNSGLGSLCSSEMLSLIKFKFYPPPMSTCFGVEPPLVFCISKEVVDKSHRNAVCHWPHRAHSPPTACALET